MNTMNIPHVPISERSIEELMALAREHKDIFCWKDEKIGAAPGNAEIARLLRTKATILLACGKIPGIPLGKSPGDAE